MLWKQDKQYKVSRYPDSHQLTNVYWAMLKYKKDKKINNRKSTDVQ